MYVVYMLMSSIMCVCCMYVNVIYGVVGMYDVRLYLCACITVSSLQK